MTKPAPDKTAGAAVAVREAGVTIGSTVVLQPTSLDAKPGRCLVLRGPNGSGKTTLLRLLAGLNKPTTGTLTLDGKPIDERSPTTRRAVAALLGPPAAYRDLTLIDHLVLVDSSWGGDPNTADERGQQLLNSFEIGTLHDRFPHELSSGQQQLFHLSLVWARPGRLLLLDEPEQRLDTDKRLLVTERLRAEAAKGRTVVLACHDPEMIERLGADVVWLGQE